MFACSYSIGKRLFSLMTKYFDWPLPSYSFVCAHCMLIVNCLPKGLQRAVAFTNRSFLSRNDGLVREILCKGFARLGVKFVEIVPLPGYIRKKSPITSLQDSSGC